MTQQVASTSYPIGNPFLGSWTYRSFINNPDITKDFNELEFGRGELVIEDAAVGTFQGRLIFAETYQFKLSGASSFGNPFTVRFQGIGDAPDSKGQVYDYIGYLVPIWPNGIGQRSALVGSIVRTIPHNGDKAKAGVVASWIALKRD